MTDAQHTSEQDQAEIEAQLAASKKMVNILLLGIAGGVIGVLLFGIYQMVKIVIENT